MTTKTFRLHSGSMDRPWHVLDAKGRPLGRLASEAAQLLMGKHKPTYEPHLPMGDYVVVINAKESVITGNKATQKVYYRHSGYPGGLKERTYQEQFDRDPRRVIERAVRGMLPSTTLGRELFRHLHVYSGPTHPHAAQVRAGTGARAQHRAEVEAAAAASGTPAPTASRRRTRSASPAAGAPAPTTGASRARRVQAAQAPAATTPPSEQSE
jgi:large subunit ribosomal protein L13